MLQNAVSFYVFRLFRSILIIMGLHETVPASTGMVLGVLENMAKAELLLGVQKDLVRCISESKAKIR